MASGSKHPPGRGGNGSADSKVRRTQSRKPTMLNVPQEEEATLLVDSELVPILRVANEIETLNPRVAHLCRFHVFEKAHKLDPVSSKRGTRRFKTYLLDRKRYILD
ncbi:unnamed protein product [Musa acuminata subsp. malaccensis]|uniref:(wild Malaysian banana) hypothetical protein n=1 Tax=Musa acuminata subsp. malaccensis TaxID=214687 RepID=A0A804J2T0_MUSAM|nr:PREDICTED: putative callose synthase 6 [Musa acuminata subsp. malaccensis]CAG1838035.1 unnamed protein product [Musa acuminata subsp. malaccensis]